MSESLLSTAGAEKSTRVDTAHDLMSTIISSDEHVPWLALAGRDPDSTSEQLDRQTSELLGYVQQQNEELDARQAELNAKLAQLDNELRTSRLQDADTGTDLLESAEQDSVTQPLPPKNSKVDVDEEPSTVDEPNTLESFQEFEEVQQLVEQIMGKALGPDATTAVRGSGPATAEDRTESSSSSRLEDESPLPASSPLLSPVSSFDSYPHILTDSHLGHAGPERPHSRPIDAQELDSERRQLADQKLELDQRRAVLARMQDETQALHKESLEMRFVTEQLWAKLCKQVPAAQINELLDGLRARLDTHYATQEDRLVERKSELEKLQASIQSKQNEVREQSRKLQDWVEARHDQIKDYAAQVDAREALLDQREHRIRADVAKWEAQRSAFQQQIRTLIAKLNSSGIGTK